MPAMCRAVSCGGTAQGRRPRAPQRAGRPDSLLPITLRVTLGRRRVPPSPGSAALLETCICRKQALPALSASALASGPCPPRLPPSSCPLSCFREEDGGFRIGSVSPNKHHGWTPPTGPQSLTPPRAGFLDGGAACFLSPEKALYLPHSPVYVFD